MKRGGKGKLTKKSNWKKAYISLTNEDRIEISQD
jgi:ribosomal protein L23